MLTVHDTKPSMQCPGVPQVCCASLRVDSSGFCVGPRAGTRNSSYSDSTVASGQRRTAAPA